jgi:signal transduction histidine kinase/CheY-like chemotaxis protein
MPERTWSPLQQRATSSQFAIAAVVTVGVAIAYFHAAQLSLALLAKSDGVAVFWPAAGIASGVLIAAGPAARWPVVFGVIPATIAANLLGDRNIYSSVFSAVANAGEAVLVAGLIEHFFRGPFDLNELRRVLGLFAATFVGTALSGFVGTSGFVLFHSLTAAAPTIWLHWVASDALGTIAVAPLAIALASLIRNPPPKHEIIEGTVPLALLCILCALLVLLPNRPWTVELAIASLCPLFVWIAARFQPSLTAIATFICAITVVWTTTFAIGIFGDPRLSVEERVLSAQATILATSFGGLVLAALFSERRRHESEILERDRRLQEALRAGGVIAFNWDLVKDEVRHSENATQILGPGSNLILSGAEWLKRINPEDHPRLAATTAHPSASSQSVAFRYMRTDGDEVWLEQIAVTEFDTCGKPKRVHGLTADITERKRFEEDIARAQKSAERADRAKSSFLAAASHDLRQPLQTLKFLQEALERQPARRARQELVARIGRSLDTMSSILSSLLDVNQLETGTLVPSRSDFAIDDIFVSVTTDFTNLVEEKSLRCRVVRSGLIVHSDKRMLEEMIRNLVSNAVRYTDSGKILLGCRRTANNVRVEVWDSGAGIAKAQLPRIFEEHYQGPEGLARGGFGLGLAIVRRLGEILGHTIDVRSTVGKGTGFSIKVPLGQTNLQVPLALQATGYSGGRFDGIFLVVEDEASVRTSIGRFMKVAGIRAVLAGTANEAIALIADQGIRPDFVLCDYNLRGSADGLECIKDVRATLKWEIPAAVMTGDTRSETMEKIASQGISVLIKPFSTKHILELIDRPPASVSHDLS